METSRSPSVAPKRPANIDLRRLVGSVNQLRFNDNRGEVSFFGQKMIILRRDVVRVIREGLERLVGEQAIPFLSYLASGIGIHEGSIFRESINSNGNPNGINDLVVSALEDTNLGLGKIKIASLDVKEATADVSISNCFEAMENGGSETPNCTFTSGFLAGMFAEVFDKTVQALETKCISQGEKECQFQISPVDESQSNDGNEPVQDSPVREEIVETPPTRKPEPPKTSLAVENKQATVQASKEDQSPFGPTPSSGTSQSEIEAGLEKASRIEKRKRGFWNRKFKGE